MYFLRFIIKYTIAVVIAHCVGGSKQPARIVYGLECTRYKNMHLYFPLKFDTVGTKLHYEN